MIGGRVEFSKLGNDHKSRGIYVMECIGKASNSGYNLRDGDFYINNLNANKEVHQVLKDNFKSIEFIDKRNFRFNEEADEAYFLLWSNEGIDI